MEFFIKKNATLPLLLVGLMMDGRTDYHNLLTGTTVLFSMTDLTTKNIKILNKSCSTTEVDGQYYVSYQFTSKNTNKIGRYEANFNVSYDYGRIVLPLREKIYINVVDSFAGENLSYSSENINIYNNCCDDTIIDSFLLLTENGARLTTEDDNNIEYL